MTTACIRPYGSWESPVTSDLIVATTIGLGEITLHGDEVYWLEMRPEEGGRQVLVRRSADGALRDVNPAPYNARTRVHEYGGGSYLLGDDGVVFLSNFADQRLYVLVQGAEPQALTPEGEFRYADGVLDRSRRRLICVREDHSNPGREPINTLVAVPLASPPAESPSVLVSRGRLLFYPPAQPG